MPKRILTWLVVAYLVYFVLHEPQHAGEVVRSGMSAIIGVGDKLLAFFDSLSPK